MANNDMADSSGPQARQDQHAWLANASEAGQIGLWRWSAATQLVQLSRGGLRMLGLPPGAASLSCERLLEIIDTRDTAGFRVALSEAMFSDQAIEHEIRLHNTDNSQQTRSFCVTGRVTARESNGRASTITGALHDITQRRRQQETADILNRELMHRMKNLFSVVNSIASVSAENHPEAEDFVAGFQSRLNSLASAHELLRSRQTQVIALEPLVEAVLAPLGLPRRIAIQSSDMYIGSGDVQTLVLVLHELATNAIKYGALSTADGHVQLDFKPSLGPEPETADIVMLWRETGGPPVTPPSHKGFGVILLERLAKRQHSGLPVIEWRETGLVCQFRFGMFTH